eukprot:TRINITY_DN1512_c0_g1_i2.p1 TRINITY_DN1512_c0_g1~~TRINITY_DN1512_c0_g1_i2.p1  ORF type:complete len:1024 (-),score=244.04 TRINITY_DN1512_c0_g1_i2:51-3122(-)
MALSFGVTLKEIRDMMQLGNIRESEKRLETLGGVQGLAQKLNVDVQRGLSGDKSDIELRLATYGSNVIPPKRQTTLLELMWDALHDFTLILLICSAILSLILTFTVDTGHKNGWIEGTAILVTVVAVVFVSAINDYQKEKQFRKLNAVKEDEPVNVVRNGEQTSISIYSLCCGDVVELTVGDIIPSDGLVIRSNDLKVNESSLTGESDDIKKHVGNPWLYSGTKVMEGWARMLVVAVGPNSQSGIIKTLIMTGSAAAVAANAEGGEKAQKKEEKGDEGTSVLQAKLEALALRIAKWGSGVAFLTVVILFIRFFAEMDEWKDEYFGKMVGFIITGVTIAVVAIPEGLPLAVTLALAFSVRKMLEDQNLVRHLDACETMGSATTICSDKTGTLTTNRMTVMKAYAGRVLEPAQINQSGMNARLCELVSEGVSLNSTARIVAKDGDFEYIGSKTECALLKMSTSMGVDYVKIRERYLPLRLITFSSARKRMSVIIDKAEEGKHRVYSKGGPEIILPRCTHYLDENAQEVPMSEGKLKEFLGHVDAFAAEGLRTLALAMRDSEPKSDWSSIPEEECESNLALVAIFGIEDPVRPQVPASIARCKEAGITVRMVTGDNKATAESIARKCGIYDGSGLIMEGPEFRKLITDPSNGDVNQAEFDKIWPQLRVLARSSPQDKFLLVTGLRNTKLNNDFQVVAVTGDGTNDGPALKKADVGFAMGITGTSVAKDASDIILMDDNFTSIVKAVMWGRNVHDSISKFLQFQLTVNVSAITIAFVGACVLEESPLSAVQMLWVNLIMDTFASLALATEPPTEELLKRKPYKRDRPLLTKVMIRNIFGHALWQILVIFVILFAGEQIWDFPSGREHSYGDPPNKHYTMIFNTFVLMTLFNEINARSIHNDPRVWKGLFTNHIFLSIVIGTFWTQVLLINVAGRALSVKPLNVIEWISCILLGLTELPINYLLHLIPVPEEQESESEQEGSHYFGLELLSKRPTTLSSLFRKQEEEQEREFTKVALQRGVQGSDTNV